MNKEVCVGCNATNEAADKAVKRVFAVLGVDIDDPKEVSEFQEDLRFGREIRRVVGKTRMAVLLTAVSVLTAGVFHLLYVHFTGQGPKG